MILPAETLQRHWRRLFCSALGLLLAVAVLSLAFGAAPVSGRDFFAFLRFQADPHTQLILQQLRLPRALLALCVGALLASSGAVTQGLFRNPLADPSLIGVGAGASVGASVVIVLMNSVHWSLGGLSLVTLGAFCGASLTVIGVYRLASKPEGTSVSTLLLAGIAITYLAGACGKLLEFMADNAMLRKISLWQMGGIDGASYTQVGLALGVCLVTFSWLPRHFSALNALLLGEAEARHLGIDVQRVKRQLMIIVAAAVGTSVALVGMVSFVGLLVPHSVRLLIGPNHRYLIPMSACCGALLLLCADTLARSVIAPTEVPVGLITTFLGTPVFISLLRRRKHLGDPV